MSDERKPGEDERDQQGSEVESANSTDTKSAEPTTRPLPPWKVILHNDDHNEMTFVVEKVIELTPLDKESSINRTLEAHHRGQSLLLTTHQERAELYQQQFASCDLTVTIEPA